MNDIIIGRTESDREKFGKLGTILIAKHYIKMGRITSLSNNVYLDISRSHVVFICGKRGSGKSYTMGVIAEGLSDLPKEISQNLSIILIDTMGIYWTMKYPNKKDELLLKQWGLEPKGLDVKIFTPAGYYDKFKDQGIPTDFPFSILPSELDASDWCTSFNLDINKPIGVLIEKIIWRLKEKNYNYSIDDIIEEIKRDNDSDIEIKRAAINRFIAAKNWGVFSDKGTHIRELAKPGQVTVLDVSCYATEENGWAIKSLVLGIVAQKLFIDRMVERRKEEFQDIESKMHYFTEEDNSQRKQLPLVWLVIDEAHEFLPVKGKTTASQPLITILREGRQPGISLILATQQPGKIHTDVMTQSDVVIAHRLTAKIDVEALGMLMQSYMREGLDIALNNLPRVKGAAVIFDDTNEMMYPIRIRPRFTWHGGEAPNAIHQKKVYFK